MKPFRWSPEKNASLKADRGISFESIVVAIESGGLLDMLAHPNQTKYPKQRILVVTSDNYVYPVPFLEDEDCYFLKTIIPSRKATRNYLIQGGRNAEDRSV